MPFEIINKNQCFVLMPFSETFNLIFEKIKDVIVNEHKIVCLRADNIFSTGIIIDEIISSIRTSFFLIADITNKNPNVLYEMGLAHAFNKDIIILTQKVNDIPFDLRHRRIIMYSVHNLSELGLKLSKTIDEIKWKGINVKEWISTKDKNIKIGIEFPISGTKLFNSTIIARGKVVGLPSSKIQYLIKAYVFTDIEYAQGVTIIDEEGNWEINKIYLGGAYHKIYFKIYDESGRTITSSDKIIVEKIS